MDLDKFFMGLTPEETVAVFEQAWSMMAMQQRFEALDAILTDDEKDECVARWS